MSRTWTITCAECGHSFTQRRKGKKRKICYSAECKRERANRRHRDRYEARRDLGLCVRCNADPVPGLTVCEYHRVSKQIQNWDRQDKLRKAARKLAEMRRGDS